MSLGFNELSDFNVSIKIYLLDLGGVYYLSDLDNLSKSILDTLFRRSAEGQAGSAVTGALFQAHDGHVTRLTISKSRVFAADEEGADIEVSWNYLGEPGIVPKPAV
jgi:hypothetical protein